MKGKERKKIDKDGEKKERQKSRKERRWIRTRSKKESKENGQK